jgi:lysophospholipase L1-like esterase
MTGPELTYDNRTGRGPGRVVRALGLVLPGVRHVWSQVGPYADAWQAANRVALAQPGRRWIVLGDSMSQGIGASTHDDGWVGQLRRRLAGSGHDLVVVNLSATGARVPDLLDQQLPVLEALGPRDDDVVTVLVGSNDLFAGADSRAGLPDAFAALLARLPRGSVVATLPDHRTAAREANAHIAEAAAAGRVRVLDLATDGPSSWRGRLAGDFFHPNDAGYAAIADAFEPLVRRALAEGDEGAADDQIRPDGS